MNPNVFKDQLYGVIMTLYRLNIESGMTHDQSIEDTRKFLIDTANAMTNIPENFETEEQT